MNRLSLLAGCLSACVTVSNPVSNPSTPSSTPSEPLVLPQGGDCVDEVAPSVVEAQEAVIQATADSTHEMVACGGLALDLSASVYRILLTSILEANDVSVPGGFVYDGDGGYESGSMGTEMVVRYQYGDDLVAGAEGELIRHNLFEFDNYLRGVSLSVDPVTQEAIVSFTGTGPLIELLGKGAAPQSPLRFTVEDLEFPYRLGRTTMTTEVVVDDAQPGATVSYMLGSAPNRLNPLLSGTSALTFDLLSLMTIAENGAKLTASSVGIDYDDSPGNLDGDIAFELRDGGLNLNGQLSFRQSTVPSIHWWCP